MGKIIRLPPEIVTKIAAGEVVERPASVVKELIENSIDAQASLIKIEIEKSGLRKMRVIDNGKGMDKKDLLLCLKPHTTSKILKESDLTQIKSLGFRGEALSSISSVSNVLIKSKQVKKDYGFMVTEGYRDSEKLEPTGMPTGTEVVVQNLFVHTPGRRKFLKSESTEFKHVLSVVTEYALANPKIGFVLSHNRRVILNIPSQQSQDERSNILLGNTLFSNLIPLSHKKSHFSISGYISKPQVASKYKTNQFVFVNKRSIKSPLISSTVKSAYGTLLDTSSHPSFVIFLKIPHEMVDINIHPRKTEVRFHDNKFIADLIQESVKRSLEKYNLTYTTDIFGRKTSSYTFGILKDSAILWDARTLPKQFSEVLQVDNLYLVTQTSDSLLIIDQHAAHEKILYEELVEQFRKQSRSTKNHTLDKASIFDLSLPHSHILEENIETLRKLGFDIEVFGKHTYKVNSIPKFLQEHNISDLITEIIEDISQGKKPNDISQKNLKTISYLACRSALKAGDRLTPKERKRLVEKLMKTKTAYTCPHGRPAMVQIKIKDLDRMFRRR